MFQRLGAITEDSNLSIGSKSSVSPSESRVLSEQSEITLDSDSKLSNSVLSKPLQSPQNSVSKTRNSSSIIQQRNFGEVAAIEENKDKEQPTPTKSPQNPEPSVPRKNKKQSFAEQDMFSEHFDVSISLFIFEFNTVSYLDKIITRIEFF